MKKVLFLVNLPSAYRVDFFCELGKYCELTVLFELQHAEDRDEKWHANVETCHFNAIFLKPLIKRTSEAFCPGVIKYLNQKKYDIIIVGGYSTLTGLLAISYLKMKRIPFVLNCDGGFVRESEGKLNYAVKKFFICSAERWLSPGEVADEYLVYYGANREKILHYPFTSVKESDVLQNVLDSDQKKEYRNKLGLSTDKKVCLYVGSLIPRKGFDILTEALKEVDVNVQLVVVGGYPSDEYVNMADCCIKSNKNVSIEFVDFKTKEELKDYYYAADLFILPTREDIWGLVINEAMAAGLPLITTDNCGAGMELLRREPHAIVAVGNVEALQSEISFVLKDDDILQKMAQSNLEMIRNYTIEKMAEAVATLMK